MTADPARSPRPGDDAPSDGGRRAPAGQGDPADAGGRRADDAGGHPSSAPSTTTPARAAPVDPDEDADATLPPDDESFDEPLSPTQPSIPPITADVEAQYGRHHAGAHPTGRRLAILSLTALGVVYGDIGTSPLYAMKEAVHGPYGPQPIISDVY